MMRQASSIGCVTFAMLSAGCHSGASGNRRTWTRDDSGVVEHGRLARGANYSDFAGRFLFRMAPEDDGLRCVSGRFNDGDVSQGVFCDFGYVGP